MSSPLPSKRSYDQTASSSSSSSSTKRINSARRPQLYTTPPSSPKKSSINGFNPKAKLVTSFQKVFNKTSFSSLVRSVPPSSPSSSHHKFQGLPTPLKTQHDNGDGYSFISFNSLNESISELQENFESQLLDCISEQTSKAHQIFRIPEILYRIISFVDDFTIVPHEQSPVRRRPLSYQHALLIYKDKAKATRVWNQTVKDAISGVPSTSFDSNTNNLFNCLVVNKLWHRITMDIATTKHFFIDHEKWNSFVNFGSRNQLTRSKSNTKLFIMHKLTKSKQSDVEKIAPSISGQLEWIEMYICPKVLPTPSMLSGSMLKKLILPGSTLVNDSFLKLVSKSCPILEELDLRECVLVSDSGICSISRRCKGLKFINLGRHENGEVITDRTLMSIAVNNPKICTVGIAGCAITDRGLWELALHSSSTLERLSLNKCALLTNNSIPRLLENGYFPYLTVLEIRHLVLLTNLKPLVEFKRRKEHSTSHLVLIEGCEILEERMRQIEWQLDMSKSKSIFRDMISWCNDVNDGDIVLTFMGSSDF